MKYMKYNMPGLCRTLDFGYYRPFFLKLLTVIRLQKPIKTLNITLFIYMYFVIENTDN